MSQRKKYRSLKYAISYYMYGKQSRGKACRICESVKYLLYFFSALS